nr:DDE-type integrase/transposase/recombinase [Bradyrhizobium sp. CCBAU 53338]
MSFSSSDQRRRRPVSTTLSRSTWALRLSLSIRTVLNNTPHSARRPSPDGYGEPPGINRIYLLYREEGLTVRKRRARRKAVETRAPILIEARPNARWSRDFVHDQFANGRRFRILNIVDDVTNECLVAIPDTSISGRRVARELTAIVERRGKPGMIVSDHGTEFTCNAMLAWCKGTRHRLALHRTGKTDAERLCREFQRPDAR